MQVMQIKIFLADRADEIERQANHWIRKHPSLRIVKSATSVSVSPMANVGGSAVQERIVLTLWYTPKPS